VASGAGARRPKCRRLPTRCRVTSSAPDSARAPTGTPPEIIQKLNPEINTWLAEPRIKARFDKLGAEPMPMTVAELGKFVADEAGKRAKVVKFSGAKAD
jgi:tripartite-type tricarboxylate transporter receptor subunit TctC